MIKGGAVATTAKSGSSKRDEGATGEALYHLYSTRPVLTENAFKGWRHLIVKDNSVEQRITNGELLRVARFITTLGGMKTTNNYVFEKGDQKRNHVHMLVRAPKLYNLKDMTQSFRKKQKLIYETERIIQYPVHGDFEDVAHLDEWSIDLSSLTFEVELFTSNDHLFFTIEDYFYKEQKRRHPVNDPPFTDDDGPNPMMDYIMTQMCNI